MEHDVFVGRADELALATSTVESDPSRTVVVWGPAGIGKGAFLHELREHLLERGIEVLEVSGVTAGLNVPLAPFLHLLEDEYTWPSQQTELVRRTLSVLRDRARRGRLALFVDDAHRLDDASVVVVSSAARSDEIAVVLALRTTEHLPPDLEALTSGRSTTWMELRPLDRGETKDLVSALLDAAAPAGPRRRVPTVSRPVHDGIWRWSEGIPFHARDLLENALVNGAITLSPDGTWVASGQLTPSQRFADALRRRIELLPAEVVDLFRAMAVAGPLPTRITDQIAPAHLRLSAERAGLIEAGRSPADGDNVRFTHDLYAEAALERGAGYLAAITRLQALGLLRRNDEATAGFEAMEQQASTPDETAVLRSTAAWHLTFNMGDPDGAAELLQRPLDGQPDEVVAMFRSQRVAALFWAGRYQEVVDLVHGWLAEEPELQAPTACGYVSSLSVMGRPELAGRFAEECLREPPTDSIEASYLMLNLLWNRQLSKWQLGQLAQLSHPLDGLFSADALGEMSSPLLMAAMEATLDTLQGHVLASSRSYEAMWGHLLNAPLPIASLNLSLWVVSEAVLGRAERAAGLLAELLDIDPDPMAPFRWWIGRAEVLTLTAQGRLREAATRSIELAAEQRIERFYGTTSLHDAIRCGAARSVRDELSRRAAEPGATWWDATCAAHAAAAADGDVAGLLEVAGRFRQGGLLLDALEATASAVALSRSVDAPAADRVLGAAAVRHEAAGHGLR